MDGVVWAEGDFSWTFGSCSPSLARDADEACLRPPGRLQPS